MKMRNPAAAVAAAVLLACIGGTYAAQSASASTISSVGCSNSRTAGNLHATQSVLTTSSTTTRRIHTSLTPRYVQQKVGADATWTSVKVVIHRYGVRGADLGTVTLSAPPSHAYVDLNVSTSVKTATSTAYWTDGYYTTTCTTGQGAV